MADGVFINKGVWSNFTDEEMSSYVDSVYNHYRRVGFPYYPMDESYRRSEFDRLNNFNRSGIIGDGGVLKQTMHGLALAWSYQPHSFSVQCGKLKTPMDIFTSDELFRKAIHKRIRIGDNISDAGVRKILRIYSGTQGVSNFRPTVAGAIYDRYCDGGVVWDMSMGYGGRLLGAIISNVKMYYGNDPCTDTFNGLTRMAKDYAGDMSYDLSLNGSELGHPNITDGTLDLCFTSPPYFDWERYSDEPTQSFNKFPTKQLWVDGFLTDTIANCKKYLKIGGRLIMNVADTKNFENLTSECVRVIESQGFSPDPRGHMKLALSSLNSSGFKYEPCLSFIKTE
jgi:hypothetical protein